MAHEVEDEVDWSDGTLSDTPASFADVSGDSGYVSPSAHEDDGLDYLFEPRDHDDYSVPSGTGLPPVTHRPTLTRAQRARIGVHLNRREPSEQDYAHFALYQASQKAYEATYLKSFVNHALHPTQIEQCFQNSVNVYASVQEYIAAVSSNLNGLTNKMVWNAHCRATNLFSNAGKDGAPFWDVCRFDRSIFEDFCPTNTVPVAHKMNESWHRIAPEPVIVRYTTRDYPIGHHSSPIEEIDEVADTLFGEEGFGKSLPSGRSIKPPSARKSKGRGLTGARVRSPAPVTRRNNWLTSLVPPPNVYHHEFPPAGDSVFGPLLEEDNSNALGPKMLSDLRNLQDRQAEDVSLQAVLVAPDIDASADDLTRLEQLFEELRGDALSSHHHDSNTSSKDDKIEQVPTWPIRLIEDHKRRLTQNSPLIFRRALPGIRTVIAEAISQDYHPTDPSFEELIDVDGRERAAATAHASSGEVVPTVEAKVQEQSENQKELQHGKKRKRHQPGIRMFNKLVEPSKKKRRTDAASLGVESSSSSKQATGVRKQKVNNTRLSNTEPKQPEHKLANLKATQHMVAAPIDASPLSPHPSGSSTLEPHQHFPPAAYFEPKIPSEKPVWRCGIKHALGHYYNAGDRKNCPGCFTALSDNINAKVMDFYLPSRTHFRQPNPAHRWRPSKLHGKHRRSTTLSHNSIAKEAYWSAITAGSSEDDAYTIAIDAVTEHLKPKVRREPTPEPTPEPEPDIGPHSSGSTTMEHGQDLPECAHFDKREQKEELAWRCDVNHALGRYYLAGDKRTCPGCGSNKHGTGKHMEMDFYIPAGVVVRQEVEELKWKPRKPYKTRGGKAKGLEKKVTPSHNQIASKKYWEAINAGRSHEDALVFAIEETDKHLDDKEADAIKKIETRAKAKAKKTTSEVSTTASASSASDRRGTKQRRRQRNLTSDSESSDGDTAAGYTVSYSKQTQNDDLSDEEVDDAEEDEVEQGIGGVSPIEEMAITSSDDGSSSGSDSER